MGARLLRTNILSPITVLPSIDARLDVVEGMLYQRGPISHAHIQAEFVKTEDRFNEVKDALRVLNKMDLDKLIASVRIILRAVVVAHDRVPARGLGSTPYQQREARIDESHADAEPEKRGQDASAVVQGARGKPITTPQDHP